MNTTLKKVSLFITMASIFFCFGAKAETVRPPVNANVNISSNGAAARTQMPDLAVSECTLQALSGNAGIIYVGGSTVTNAAGVNKGIALAAGSSIGSVGVSNLNWIYVAADTANDDVAYLCK